MFNSFQLEGFCFNYERTIPLGSYDKLSKYYRIHECGHYSVLFSKSIYPRIPWYWDNYIRLGPAKYDSIFEDFSRVY